MASTSTERPSSSSTSHSQRSYDVFLNFRGEDTRRSFTDHLYSALIRCNIKTFRDDEKLSRGGEIKPELLKAIEGSRIAIIVFSKTYAHSKRCLEELVQIMKCKKEREQMVIPIFYDVHPSHVRNQTGICTAAFTDHEENADAEKKEKISRWRTAMREVGNLVGYDLKNRYESEVIDEIIKNIHRRLLQWSYRVFLSFRGDDTRRNFTDLLYSALVRNNINTFRDDERIPRGGEIAPELLKAIEESRIAIIVFSTHYAHSKWCLDELVKIMECKEEREQMVIPIFYHVDPSEVRNQTGICGEAFTHHEKNADEGKKERIRKWKTAMREAGNIDGYDVKNRYESELIDDIIEKIHGSIL